MQTKSTLPFLNFFLPNYLAPSPIIHQTGQTPNIATNPGCPVTQQNERNLI